MRLPFKILRGNNSCVVTCRDRPAALEAISYGPDGSGDITKKPRTRLDIKNHIRRIRLKTTVVVLEQSNRNSLESGNMTKHLLASAIVFAVGIALAGNGIAGFKPSVPKPSVPKPSLPKPSLPKPSVPSPPNPVDNAKKAAKKAAEKARRAAALAKKEREARAALERKERELREDAVRLKREAEEAAKKVADEANKAAQTTAKVADQIAETEQISREATKDATKSVQIHRVRKLSDQQLQTLSSAVSVETGRALNVQNWQQWVSQPDQEFLNAVGRGEKGIRVELGNAVDYLKGQWWYQRFQDHLLSQLLEKPEFIVCGEDRPGPEVWYVNGMLTEKARAVKVGEWISFQLNRRVHVLHNPTIVESPFQTGLVAEGFGNDDLSECVYDRIWPAVVVNKLRESEKLLVNAIALEGEKLQGNPTTRQLAWVMYHSDAPVSVVSHSQGCLITRNALFTMSLLSAEQKARKNVAWVAAGLPLNDAEIWPKPNKLSILQYHDDPVAKLCGLRGGGIELNAADHDFMEEYLDQLTDDQIWPTVSLTTTK